MPRNDPFDEEMLMSTPSKKNPLPPCPSEVPRPTCRHCVSRKHRYGGSKVETSTDMFEMSFTECYDTKKKYDDDALRRPVCEECGIAPKVAHKEMDEVELADVELWKEQNAHLVFFHCKNVIHRESYKKNGKRFRLHCNRVVCSRCVHNEWHTVHSRFNEYSDPAWRTTLFGCCDSPGLLFQTMVCFYCCDHPSSLWEGEMLHYDEFHVQRHVRKLFFANCCHFWMFPINCWLYPMMTMSMDLFCCSSFRHVRRHERELRIRFGVPEHTDKELKLFRWCVHNRLFREAEARGYPQPTFWTCSSDIPNIVAQYPPHPRLQKHTELVDSPSVAHLL